MHAVWLFPAVALLAGRALGQVSDPAASFLTCPAKDGISCNPNNNDRANPYYTCVSQGGLGADEQPYLSPQKESSWTDTPLDSYIPVWFKPALTAEDQAFLRDRTCVPNPANVCPYYIYPEPNGTDGLLSVSHYVIELAHVGEAYDDFTGITYRGLNLAWDTWNKTQAAAAKSVNAPASDGLLVFGREAFHAWWLWFPEGPRTITRNAPLPAQASYTNNQLIGNAVGVFGNLNAQFLSLVKNDSTLFINIADNLAEFHHALQKNRPSVLKHHHFRNFERSILATIKFFMGNSLTPERAEAVEEVFDFIYRFNSHFLNLYDIKCKSDVNYEDFIRDPPAAPAPLVPAASTIPPAASSTVPPAAATTVAGRLKSGPSGPLTALADGLRDVAKKL